MSPDASSLQALIAELCRPISAERPAGEDLRYEGAYDRIREARREDEAGLSQDIWATPLKRADWAEVERLCLDLLRARSKDLQLAVWLLEAWTHRRGFAGLGEGLELIRALGEQFWEVGYPPIENGDLEARAGLIEWIDDKLSLAVKRLPVTRPEAGDTPVYALADWESARRLENLARKDRAVLATAENEGRVTRAKFLISATLSAPAHYQDLIREVQAAGHAATSLERFLDAKCGKAAPGLRRVREGLSAIEWLAREMLAERGEAVEANGEVEAPAPPPEHRVADATPPRPRPGASRIQSRAEAYRLLTEASDYLMQIEPHSPTPYLVKRAIGWGRMTLTELLAELIRNPNDLMELYSFLGMRGSETTEGGDDQGAQHGAER